MREVDVPVGPDLSTPPAGPEPAEPDQRQAYIAAAAVVLLLGVGALAPDPFCMLLALVVAISSALRRWLPWDTAVPMAVLIGVLSGVGLGLAADAVAVDLLSRPLLLATWWSSACVALALSPFGHPSSSGMGLPVRSILFWVAQVPAVIAAAVAVLQQLDVARVASWMFLGSDFAEHAVLLARVQSDGNLDYGSQSYPRGVHALLGFLSAPGLPDAGTGALLTYDLRLLAAATWAFMAVLLWTMSSLVLRAGESAGLSSRWRVGAAFTLGLLVLYYGQFMLVFVAMAAAPGVVAAIALCLVPLVALTPSFSSRRMLWLMMAALLAAATLAQTWPALLPVPLMALVAATGSLRRLQGLRRLVSSVRVDARRPARAVGWTLLVLALAAATAAPILSLLRGGGVSIAAIDGGLPAPSAPLALLGTVAVVILLWKDRAAGALLGAVVGAYLTVGVLLMAAQGGMDLSQYYPRKAVWFLMVLLLPASAVVMTLMLRVASRLVDQVCSSLGRGARVARIGCAAVVVAGVVGYALPVLAVAGSLVEVASRPARPSEYRKLSVALMYAGRYDDAVSVPLALGMRAIPQQNDTYVISKLFHFRTGQPQSHGLPSAACETIRTVAGDGPSVVVTDLDPDVVLILLRRQGCSTTRVVRVPGGNESARHLVRTNLGIP